MLQSIRDHTQGWLAGTIVSVLILMFALWGINAYFAGGSTETALAKVNGAEITKERFTLAYEQARRQMQAQYGSTAPLSPKQESGLKERVLNELISTEVLKQASVAEHYYISSTQIDNYLENIPEFQDGGHFSLERFQEIMASSLYTANDLLDLIRTTLLVAQPKLGIILTSFGLPNEVNYTISLVNQERDLRYLTLTAASLARQPLPPVSANQVADYYKDHQDEFKTPEQVSVDYLELSLKDVMASLHPTAEALKNYYNENINNYTQPMQWQLQAVVLPVSQTATQPEIDAAQTKAADLLKRIHLGEDFNKLAAQYTDPNLNAILSGWVGVSQLPTALQKPVQALTRATPVSEVIRADQGFVILKMTNLKETQVQAFEQVKDKVSAALVRQQAEEKLASLRDQLADLTYEHPDSLQAASKALNLPIQATGVFTRDKGGLDISSNKKIRDAAFSNDVLSLQNNSDIIQISPETAIVLRVKSHIPPALLALGEVSKQIQDRLEAEQAKNQLAKLAQDIKQKLQGGAQEDQLALQYNLTWNTVGFIGRYSNKVPSAVLDKAFQLPRPPASSKASYAIVQLPTGFAVVALHNVRDGVSKDQKQYAMFAEQVQNSEGLLEYELYKQGLMKTAKISMLPQQ